MRSIQVKHGSYGPAHDPYGYTEIMVTEGTHRAEYFEGGLGECRLILYVGNTPLITLNFRDDDRVQALIATLRFKRHVGIKPRDAQDEYESGYRPDMMARGFI